MTTYEELEAQAIRAAERSASAHGPDSYHAALAGQALGLLGRVVKERDDLAAKLVEAQALIGGLPR